MYAGFENGKYEQDLIAIGSVWPSALNISVN